jgi:hypothetical protein
MTQPTASGGTEPAVYGPYGTERDTYDSPLTVALDTNRCGCESSTEHRIAVRDLQLQHLIATCDDRGVALGAYDVKILTWLAGYEAATVQVVIGVISRAYAAGRRDADERIAELELALAQLRGEA